MSWYYNYYLTYQTSDGKIYPLGPFDCNGKFYPVLWKSRSFASDLHNRFGKFREENWSDELKKALRSGYELSDDEEIDWSKEYVYYLPVDELPKGSLLKRGYFLTSAIDDYEETGDSEDLRYDYLTSEAYARKLVAENSVGKPEPKYDCEGNELEYHSAADYSYYAYIDTYSEEYEAYVIREAIDTFEFAKLPEGSKIVIVDSEG